MDQRFSASIRVALFTVMRLWAGTLYVNVKDGNRRWHAWQPDWEGFRFFSRIKASKIKKMDPRKVGSENDHLTMLERKVEFYHNILHGEELVAVLTLEGSKVDGLEDKNSEGVQWKVKKIYYAAHIRSDSSPPKWIEVDIESGTHAHDLFEEHKEV